MLAGPPENVFTYEATVYGEVAVRVAGRELEALQGARDRLVERGLVSAGRRGRRALRRIDQSIARAAAALQVARDRLANGLLLLTSSASALAAPVALDVRAPPGCPTQPRVAARLE